MRFREHSNLSGNHAFLSPSNYHWVNYDEQKLAAKVHSSFAAQRGSELHDLAHRMIKLGVKLPDTQQTLNAYVNDAIGFRMVSEQTLFYSHNCYGTADTIGFRERERFLRIHDLKTGILSTKVTQLEVYAALFCLEYDYTPNDINIELRIYQNDEVRIYEGDPVSIMRIMANIKHFDHLIEQMRMEAYG